MDTKGVEKAIIKYAEFLKQESWPRLVEHAVSAGALLYLLRFVHRKGTKKVMKRVMSTRIAIVVSRCLAKSTYKCPRCWFFHSERN